jgi:hypothetical protein
MGSARKTAPKAGQATTASQETTTAETRRDIAGRAAVLARNPWTLAGLVGLLAAVVLWLVVQPLAGAANDTDAATSVLYFERLVHGQRLEAFMPTTPKPFLTLVYGLAWTLTGDWRTLTILSVAVGAAAVGMAARLAARLSGNGAAAAAAIVVIGLLAWPDFGLEVAQANSFVWGLALWLLAGVLVTADRPRPWLAGAVLVLAGLTRTETIWLLGAAFACTAWLGLRALRGGDRAQLRTALPLLLGALAIPLACLHDLLLTGRPLYWLGVPAGYTAVAYPGLASVSPVESIRKELVHYEPALALLALALLGGAWLIHSRRRAVAFALASLAGGVLLTLVVLAWRGVFISARYYEEADAAVLLAAAIGAAALIVWAFDRAARGKGNVVRWRSLATAVVATALVLGVVAVDVPHGTVESEVAPTGRAYAALQTRINDLTTILLGAQGGTAELAGANYPVADAATCRLFVPRSLLPIVSIETGAPITALGDSYLAFRDGKYALKPGQWVLHISAADGSGGVYAPFEHSAPTTLTAANGRSLSVVPVVAAPDRGLWLDRIDSPPAGS